MKISHMRSRGRMIGLVILFSIRHYEEELATTWQSQEKLSIRRLLRYARNDGLVVMKIPGQARNDELLLT